VESLPGAEGRGQDRKAHKSVPPPGHQLIAEIQVGQRAGRAVWHIPGTVGPAGPEDQSADAAQAGARGYPIQDVVAIGYASIQVPKLAWTAEHGYNQRGMPLITQPERRRLCPEVYLLLDDPCAAAWALVNRNATASKQLGYLIAAAYRDVLGWPITDRANTSNIAELLGYSSPDTATRAIRRGRALWVALSAWPWWALGGHLDKIYHSPPSGWQELARVADSFAMWRDPVAYRARERAERRRLVRVRADSQNASASP
jgi:hypothetical protein